MKFFRRRLRMVWVVLIAVLCTTPGSRLLASDDEDKLSTSTNHPDDDFRHLGKRPFVTTVMDGLDLRWQEDKSKKCWT